VKSVDLKETEGWSLIFVARDGSASAGLVCRTRPRRGEGIAGRVEEAAFAHRDGSGDRQAVHAWPLKLAAKRPGECLPQNKVEFCAGMKAKVSRRGGRDA